MTNETSPRLLVPLNQAAYMLSLSQRKLWGLTADGKLPCIRIGRSVRYSVDDLREWIEAQKEGGEAK